MINQGSDILGSCGEPLESLAFPAQESPKSARSDKIIPTCRAAKRAITAWLEQYGSEASDRLFLAMLHELLWLDLVPRREYVGDPRIQAEHAAHQVEIATAYAEWKR